MIPLPSRLWGCVYLCVYVCSEPILLRWFPGWLGPCSTRRCPWIRPYRAGSLPLLGGVVTQTRLDERTPESPSQLNPAHGGQRGEKGQPEHEALKVRCGDTDRARTSTPGGGVGLLGVWVARWHRRQLSSPMQVNSIMHLWWALKYHRARRMVWADAGRIASCNDSRGTAWNYRLIFHSGQVILMLPNHKITVYMSRNERVTLEGRHCVKSLIQLIPFANSANNAAFLFKHIYDCLTSSYESTQEKGTVSICLVLT